MVHVLRIYIPLMVIVVLSWLCFWIDYRAVAARTSMSASLVLTVIMFITSIQPSLPPTSDIRVVDVHMLVCFFYVFAALVEYSIVQSMMVKLECLKKRPKIDERATRHVQHSKREKQVCMGQGRYQPLIRRGANNLKFPTAIQ